MNSPSGPAEPTSLEYQGISRDTRSRPAVDPIKIFFVAVVVGLFGLVTLVGYQSLSPALDNTPPPALASYLRGNGVAFSFAGDRTSVRLPGEPEVDARMLRIDRRNIQGSTAQVSHTSYEFLFFEVDTPWLTRASAARRRASLEGGLADFASGQGIAIAGTGKTTVAGQLAVSMRGTYHGDQAAGAAVSVRGKTYLLIVQMKKGSATALKEFEKSFRPR